ncbi:3-oxoacyl-[acyl-carrier protein] reductase [Saccharopolyspora antimicrobica]|uniref:3-oxoacyl-[acyl-carrier protein] reductase n=1 Tax=Saccharopolyspora antimicrobica TaxID=455193 RepID=A0A1I5H1S1_9PSEU|nr:3-oxoacyl-ACP reductase FabG [Saccharopolyspora antimicrobica]RKT90061.1 3-oxoacyl-[acyl-carrier protein] reductase [Saccharopolyspora antimicrobica]SFO41791.1 3-oxoacyl-[acyl-carrier protein] reductase [Saccharopolyspora antimicrobica]
MLQDKVAVITGGGKGIGFAIAENFVAHGAKVVLADIDGAQAQKAAAELGRSALGVTCDVTDQDAVQAAVEAATGEFGALDVMVNNAGITRDATMRKMTLEDFEAVLDVHVKGAWLGTRAAAAVMREQGSGSIVNISSISGKVGMIGQTNYSAAKAGIVGLTKAAAKEVAHKGVRVNAVQPGLIRTDMTAALREDVWQAKLQEIPMQRAGEPSEVADVVLFLASGLSSYMTGCVLEITGGRHL